MCFADLATEWCTNRYPVNICHFRNTIVLFVFANLHVCIYLSMDMLTDVPRLGILRMGLRTCLWRLRITMIIGNVLRMIRQITYFSFLPNKNLRSTVRYHV